jgi:hypothetical protein
LSIILDESDDPSRLGQEKPQRLKALRAWLAHRERQRRAEATRDIVMSLYPTNRRGTSGAGLAQPAVEGVPRVAGKPG